MAKEFLAKDFSNRQDLETIIKMEVGTDIEGNKAQGNVIKGTREKLKKLHLDDVTEVFGCKCIITDSPTSESIKEKKKIKK